MNYCHTSREFTARRYTAIEAGRTKRSGAGARCTARNLMPRDLLAHGNPCSFITGKYLWRVASDLSRGMSVASLRTGKYAIMDAKETDAGSIHDTTLASATFFRFPIPLQPSVSPHRSRRSVISWEDPCTAFVEVLAINPLTMGSLSSFRQWA